ncbi:MAG: porin [Gemmatimonadales bacterium]
MLPCRVLPLVFGLLVPGSLGAQSPAAGPAVRFTGYLQVRETYQHRVGLTASINRARLAAYGEVTPALTWRIQGEFRTGSVGTGKASVSLQDAYARYARDAWALQAGQFKTPFTREFVTSLADLEMPDRTMVVDSLAPKRDIGAMVEYRVRKAVTMWLGVFNGEGQNVTANRDSSALGVGRLVVRPVPRLALGVEGARYFADSTRYGLEANYEGAHLSLRTEYVGQHRDQQVGDDHGWYALGAYQVNPLIQLVARYEEFERTSAPGAQTPSAWGAGTNLFFAAGKAKLMLDYLSRKSGTPATTTGLLLSQLQVRF